VENTLPAFEHAVKHGTELIEFDVRLTRDHEVRPTPGSLERMESRIDPWMTTQLSKARRITQSPIARLY
jgi:hypothetical protein